MNNRIVQIALALAVIALLVAATPSIQQRVKLLEGRMDAIEKKEGTDFATLRGRVEALETKESDDISALKRHW